MSKRRAWRQTTTSSSARGYGAQWAKLREAKLRANPMCETGCGAPATQVDHIRSKAEGGTNDDTNLRSLCSACHKQKTSSEAGKAAAGGARRETGATDTRGTTRRERT